MNDDDSSVRFGSILLKKSTMFSTAKKYALEIEIFNLRRGFGAQLLRSFARKKMRFQQSVQRQSGGTDFSIQSAESGQVVNLISYSFGFVMSFSQPYFRKNRCENQFRNPNLTPWPAWLTGF